MSIRGYDLIWAFARSLAQLLRTSGMGPDFTVDNTLAQALCVLAYGYAKFNADGHDECPHAVDCLNDWTSNHPILRTALERLCDLAAADLRDEDVEVLLNGCESCELIDCAVTWAAQVRK